MEREKGPKAFIEQHADASTLVKFPPGFFQKAYDQKEKFSVQITESRVFLRKPNGRIITWTFLAKNPEYN